MNANENSIQSSAKLKQIQTVSRVAKFLALGFLIFSAGFMLLMLSEKAAMLFRHPPAAAPVGQSGDFALNLMRALAAWGFQIVLCVWYWKLSRLFRCYERGLIFAAESIRCIKVLGALFLWGGMFTAIIDALPKPPPPILQSGVTLVQTHAYHMGFFRFDFGTGINFGLLLAGAVIVLIAWIMDEGRKLQEEQALTV
jgi:Protein of unknown function (DUF2975)